MSLDVRSLTVILLTLLVFLLQCPLASNNALADHHGWKHHLFDHDKGHTGGPLFPRGKDEGNETTGIITAWIFAAANVPVAISIFLEFLLIPFVSEEREKTLKRFNRRQKRYMMPLHHVGNVVAVSMALLHFLLSRCSTTSLPEWGLAAVIAMAFMGMSVKYRFLPLAIRKRFAKIHTHPAVVGSIAFMILWGHQLVD